jgi:hypothetical protein
MTNDPKVINEFLKGFGSNLRGEPLFRLVRAEEQLEFRRGTFNEFYGKVFVRTVTGVKQTKKYDFLPPCWILEQWLGPEQVANLELPESNLGSYECRYPFVDNKNKELPLNGRVVEILMYNFLKPQSSPDAIRSRIKLELEQLDEKESKYFDDVLDDGYIIPALAGKVGVSMHITDPNFKVKKAIK